MPARRYLWPFLLACLASLCARPCPAELVILGPSRNEVTLRRVYGWLPERGKEFKLAVHEVRPSRWSDIDPDDPDAVGLYNQDTGEVFLRLGEDELEITFAHEVGHHVYFTALTGAERRSWKRYWKQNRDRMPEGDAQSCPEEGFAECFAATYCRVELPYSFSRRVAEQVRSYFLTTR